MKSRREIMNEILDLNHRIQIEEDIKRNDPSLTEDCNKSIRNCEIMVTVLRGVLNSNPNFTIFNVLISGAALLLINVVAHSVSSGTIPDMILSASFTIWSIFTYVYHKYYS